MTAKAAVFVGVNQPFEIREYPVGDPPAGYAMMSLVASGVCGTDLHIHRGKLGSAPPQIIGHEFVGRVEMISPPDSERYGIHVGDTAIVDIACPCGECALCLSGDDANCLNLGVTNGGNPDTPPHFHGGYAEYNCSPVKNLVKLPDGLDAAIACAYACAGPTAIHAFSLADRARVDLTKINVAVVQGLGPVGTFAVMYLSSLGINNIIAVSGRSDTRREALVRELGATEVISLKEDGEQALYDAVSRASGGVGADLVYEASGDPSALPTGLGLLKNRGVYLVPGQYSNSGGVMIEPQLITFKALRILGSSQYSFADVESYIRFMESHPRLHKTIEAAITKYPIADINLAIRDAGERRSIKIMLAPEA